MRSSTTSDGHVAGDGFSAEVTADKRLGDDAEVVTGPPDDVKFRSVMPESPSIQKFSVRFYPVQHSLVLGHLVGQREHTQQGSRLYITRHVHKPGDEGHSVRGQTCDE